MALNPAIVLGAQAPQPAQNPIQQLAGLLQIAQAQRQGQLTDLELAQKREIHPIALEEARMKANQHKLVNDLISRSMGGVGTSGGDVASQGGALGVFQNKLRFAQALALADPARGRAQMEALKLEFPDVKWEGGIPLHPRTGQPISGAPIIPQINQAGFGTTKAIDPNTGQISVSPTPGAQDAFALQQKIIEDAKAKGDLVVTPPVSPGTPPVYRSRADILGAGQPAPPTQAQSIAQGMLAQERAGSPVRVQVPGGAMAEQIEAELRRSGQSPSGVIPNPSGGVPAGMSPQQEATAAANKEFQVQDAKSRAAAYETMQKVSMGNQAKIAKFERIGNLLKDYDGGKLAPAGFELARFGTSLGIQLDPKLPNKEAAVALANEAALDLRTTADGGGMPGALSDADREFLKSMTPQLGQTAEGRKKVIESRVLVWKREQKVAEMARQYRQKHGTIDEAFFSQLQAWSDRNPVFNAN